MIFNKMFRNKKKKQHKMSEEQKNGSQNTEPKVDHVEEPQVVETEAAEAQPEAAQEQPAEPTLEEQLAEARAQVEKEKKEYLFLMADFDNFRKRVLKEKADLIKNGAEKALRGILPIVDDFERGLQATKDAEDAAAVREGMELIYQKFVKYLAENGVVAMAAEPGIDFDADLHEAIATIPAPAPELKGKVVDTTQKGYTLNGDKVLRHAKVVVGE